MAQETAPVPVCAIGASAGGVQALTHLFQELRPDLGLAYVVITHLDPEHPSQMSEILERRTSMPVEEVAERARIEADRVYLIPPDRELVIDDNDVHARPFSDSRGHRAPIDIFFRSLAHGRADGIAVVLSGSGSDGAVGVRAVKEAGGVILVQEPSTAEFPTMPRSAMATGDADFVLPLPELAAKIGEVARNKRAVQDLSVDEAEDGIRAILHFLRARTGHDFSSYKKATVLRRILRRMQITRQHDLAAYGRLLREDAEEARRLFDDLLISVTLFFRDPHAFEALEREVVPHIFDMLEDDEGIRAWVVGCATGEEAYSLAMLLLEAAESRQLQVPMQIFASDLDETALQTAREGRFPASIAADVSQERLDRFFVAQGNHYRVRKEVRDVVLFATHSVLKEPPFTRLHLITCRNLLIYLDRDMQRQLATLFHYALVPHGYLFLGSAEVVDAPELFATVDRDARIWQARPHAKRAVPKLPALAIEPEPQTVAHGRRPTGASRSPGAQHLEDLERHAPPSVLVDGGGQVLHLSESAGRFLLPSRGPLPGDLAQLVRPELRMDLATALDRAFQDGVATLTYPVDVAFDDTRHRMQVQVTPVTGGSGTPERALIFFLDGGAAPAAGPGEETATSSAEVRRLEEELHDAHTRLGVSRQEHESAIQELRAANEELQSINEEYRSTSEELETSKEELQSINEELQTVNAELKSKLEAISTAHSDLQNLIAAADIGTLFLDDELRIRLLTPAVCRLFNVTEDDVGRVVTDFTHRLADDGIEGDALAVLRDLVPVEREIRSHDGAWLLLRMRPYRTIDNRIDGVVVSFIDVTARRDAEQRLRESEGRLRSVLDAVGVVAFEWDGEGDALVEEGPVERLFDGGDGARPASLAALLERLHPDDRDGVRQAFRQRGGDTSGFSVDFRLAGIGRWCRLSGRPVGSEPLRILGTIQDVSQEKSDAEAQRTLVRELNHRVKNTLSIVMSLLHQTRRSSSDFDAFAAAFEDRIHALARAHDLLTRSNWNDVDLRALVQTAVTDYAADAPDRLRLSGPAVTIPASVAVDLAMALNELGTNALKHGALSVPGGVVDISWHLENETGAEPSRVVLRWQEQKGPPVAPPTRRGFGTRLLERALARDAGGTATLEFARDGLVYTATFPRREVAS